MGRGNAINTARELVALATGNSNQCGQYSHEEVREIAQAVLGMDEKLRCLENPIVRGVREALIMAEGRINGLTGLEWSQRALAAEQKRDEFESRARWDESVSNTILEWYDNDGSAATLPGIVDVIREGHAVWEAAVALDVGQEYEAAPALGSNRGMCEKCGQANRSCICGRTGS